MECVCGLLTQSQQPVPLKSISIDVLVRGFVADVVSELQYKNEEKNPVEAVFVFPLDDEAAVYAFEGMIDGTRIEAQIREKKQAEQEYDDALSEGRETFLLNREEKSSDIFTCSLGNLPPDGEATLKLRYVQVLALEADGAVRFVLPAVLNPRYVPQGSEGDTVTKSVPRVPPGQLPYTLSLSATVHSTYGINRIESKCTLEPLCYIAVDRTSAQVSLAEGHQFDRDVELLIYYEDVHKPSALLEAGKPGVAPGSLMGDPALLLTLYPNFTATKPGQKVTGEFIFLLDRSGSMGHKTDPSNDSPSRIQSAKDTLIFLLKSLPLGCYFNIYGFGSHHDSFYQHSVEYTQQTMLESLERVKKLEANLGGTEILQPLKAIYSQPCREGYPRQLFLFTDGEVHNTGEVIAEVKRYSNSHRCFSFGIGEGASTALVKGVARAACGSAEFITGKERMQAKALQSLKKALQSAVTKISLNWDLPPGLEAVLVGSGPQVIFQGQRCLIYAQIRGQHQSSPSTEGTAILHYTFQKQTFMEKAKFSLHAQEEDRLPVHRLAAKTLLQELEGSGEMEEEKKHLALETSLSSGVVCSQTAYVGVNTELGKPIQRPLMHRHVPVTLQGFSGVWMTRRLRVGCEMLSAEMAPMSSPQAGNRRIEALGTHTEMKVSRKIACFRLPCLQTNSHQHGGIECRRVFAEPVEKELLLLELISLQNADGSWPLSSGLAHMLGQNKATLSKTPSHVAPKVWATVLAILWLHSKALEQKDEWELLAAKGLSWLQTTAGPQLAECVRAGNALLGTNVNSQVFGL